MPLSIFGDQFSLDVEALLSYNIGRTGISMEIILFLSIEVT
jgi:hypothetical protein